MESENQTLVNGGSKQQFFTRFKFFIIAAVILLAALAIVLAVVLTASSNKDNNSSWEGLIEVDNIMSHLRELQRIADANNNTRASTTSGYNKSVEFIVEQLRKHTDFNVTVQDFSYDSNKIRDVSNLNITVESGSYTLVYGKDFGFMGAFAGTYNIDARVTQALGYGCSPAEYDNVLPGTVALVKRGNCTFVEKVALAESKSPLAVVIYNEGNTPDRLGLFSGGLGDVAVPVIATTYYAGVSMVSSNITLSFTSELVTSYTMNIIADTKSGKSDSVIVIGSHLDSVPAGPGINDNGSGSSLNLELALLVAAHQNKLKNKVRFAWFGAEELGLLGSNFYVDNLNATDKVELANIAVNLNFDMIGSPNFIRGVYDGASDPLSNGSAVVQTLFNKYFESQGLTVIPTDFTGRSDYGPFLAAGIPAGGLFTGAEETKTIAQRITFGGLAGASFDPCYHQACDTIDNINKEVLGDMSKGAAHVLETLATQENLRLFLNKL